MFVVHKDEYPNTRIFPEAGVVIHRGIRYCNPTIDFNVKGGRERFAKLNRYLFKSYLWAGNARVDIKVLDQNRFLGIWVVGTRFTLRRETQASKQRDRWERALALRAERGPPIRFRNMMFPTGSRTVLDLHGGATPGKVFLLKCMLLYEGCLYHKPKLLFEANWKRTRREWVSKIVFQNIDWTNSEYPVVYSACKPSVRFVVGGINFYMRPLYPGVAGWHPGDM